MIAGWMYLSVVQCMCMCDSMSVRACVLDYYVLAPVCVCSCLSWRSSLCLQMCLQFVSALLSPAVCVLPYISMCVGVRVPCAC